MMTEFSFLSDINVATPHMPTIDADSSSSSVLLLYKCRIMLPSAGLETHYLDACKLTMRRQDTCVRPSIFTNAFCRGNFLTFESYQLKSTGPCGSQL